MSRGIALSAAAAVLALSSLLIVPPAEAKHWNNSCGHDNGWHTGWYNGNGNRTGWRHGWNNGWNNGYYGHRRFSNNGYYGNPNRYFGYNYHRSRWW